MVNQWEDPLYHMLEAMRELSAGEVHLVQYIKVGKNSEILINTMEELRRIRKQLEEDTFGRQ